MRGFAPLRLVTRHPDDENSRSVKTPSRPNILWFSLEDTSPLFGCYGDPVARTPNLDRVAAEGCVYERAFCTAAVCAPSRNSIITGRYATANGAHHMRTSHPNPFDPASPTPYEAVPPPQVKAFTEYLRAAGYFCSNNLKTDYQMGTPSSIWDQCGPEAHWRRRAPGQPFFAVFNPTITHESGQWPKDGESLAFDPDAVEVPPFLPDTPEVRQSIARQHGNIAASDAILGRLLAELEADGLRQDTLIFVWSDHGMGLPRFKRWPYDSGLRIPLLVRAPGLVAPGSRNPELVSLVDLAPTMLSLAGLDRPHHLHGRVFLGPDRDPPRTHVFATRDRYDECYDKVRSVRDDRYRYLRHGYPNLEREVHIPYRNRHPAMREIWKRAATGSLQGAQQWFAPGPRRAEELYDTWSDPWETENRIDDPSLREVRAALREELDRWQERYDPWYDIPEVEMVRRWHPNGTQPDTAPPVAVPHGPHHPGLDTLAPDSTLVPPLLIQLVAGTEGASIEYQIDPSADSLWTLYSGPFALPAGASVLRARAIRYGYRPSPEVEWSMRWA